YQWYWATTEIPGATSATYDASLIGEGYYYVLITDNNGCSASSFSFYYSGGGCNVPTPAITQSGNTWYASPSTGYSYQWYHEGTIIVGATNATYDASQTGSGNYSVWVTDNNGCDAFSATYYYSGGGCNLASPIITQVGNTLQSSSAVTYQ